MKLGDLLEQFRGDLLAYVSGRGGRVLRFESADDVVQGIHVRALEQNFEYRGEKPFLEWMYKIARSHLADRHAYWMAVRRRPTALFRLTQNPSSTGDGRAVAEPARESTGPATFAERREELEVLYEALAALLSRDQQLIRWSCEGIDLDEMASRLDTPYEATRRARLRALERFRKAHRLVQRARHLART